MTLTPDYDVNEVAAALKMSPRWVRQQVAEGAAHNRYGHKLRFTQAQVDALRRSFEQASVTPAITATRRRKAS